jgi:hypothetical protein
MAPAEPLRSRLVLRASDWPAPFRLDRLEYSAAELVLRIALRTPLPLPEPPSPWLLVERHGTRLETSPMFGCASPDPRGSQRAASWRGSFPLSHDLACDPATRFSLLFGELQLAFTSLTDAHAAGPMTCSPAVRRTALACALGFQLCLAPALSGVSAAAAASTSSPSEATGEPAGGPEAPPRPGGGASPGAESQSASGLAPPAEQPASQAGTPGAGAGAQTPAVERSQQSSSSTSVTHVTLTLPPPTSGHRASPPNPAHRGAAPQPGPNGLATPSPGKPAHGKPAPDATRPSERRAGAHTPAPERSHRHPLHAKPSKPAPPSAPPAEAETPATGVPPQLELPQSLVELPAGLIGSSEAGPPAYLIPLYEEAGARYHVPWRVLAAINGIESSYGKDLSTSSAGAIGWMQFMPATWAEWAVDADGDGNANPYSPRDAIFTAARYLQASGAEHDLSGAIFAYNHADWYVAEVLFRARTLDTASLADERSYALPLDQSYMHELGRTDDGVDIETAPDGAPVYSITAGVVSAVASDPGGFGPNYPVIEATSGPLAGQHIYYGHVAQALVAPGEHVAAGQPIAIMGHAGDAASLGHGHIEIGFSDASGDPLSHHGASAWTPSGEIMREVLISLCAAHGIHAS